MARIRDRAVHLGIKTSIRVAIGGTVAEKVGDAWRKVNQIRLAGNCDDELAAVEHYLYTRFLVATYGPLIYFVIYGMDSFYRILKVARTINPYIPLPQEGPCPPSPNSFADWRWTQTGIEDGWDDFWGLSDLSTLADDAPQHPRPLL
jgi:hypothetical protein